MSVSRTHKKKEIERVPKKMEEVEHWRGRGRERERERERGGEERERSNCFDKSEDGGKEILQRIPSLVPSFLFQSIRYVLPSGG